MSPLFLAGGRRPVEPTVEARAGETAHLESIG
jgi:hypothetical protein